MESYDAMKELREIKALFYFTIETIKKSKQALSMDEKILIQGMILGKEKNTLSVQNTISGIDEVIARFPNLMIDKEKIIKRVELEKKLPIKEVPKIYLGFFDRRYD